MQTLITMQEWEQHKRFVGLTQDDVDAIVRLQPVAKNFVQEVVEALYEHLLSFNQTRSFLTSPELMGLLREAQSEYFLQLFAGDYGEKYLKSRIHVGRIHYRVGLPVSIYMATYSHYFRLIRPHIFEYLDDTEMAFRSLDALGKLITLDEIVAVDAYIETMVNSPKLQVQNS